MRRGPTLRATPSLRLSLAAKPNDIFTLKVSKRDSVTFSTVRHRFDINRIAAVALNCSVTAPTHLIRKGLPYLSETVTLTQKGGARYAFSYCSIDNWFSHSHGLRC